MDDQQRAKVLKTFDCVIEGAMKQAGAGEVGEWVAYEDHKAAITAALRAAPEPHPYGWVITSDSGIIFCPASARSVMESNSTELSKQLGITVVEVFANGLTAIPCPVSEPRPLHEWHEDYGPAVWWSWDDERGEWLGEPAWIGSPGDSDWPGYHTHWTPHPELPVAARPQGVK